MERGGGTDRTVDGGDQGGGGGVKVVKGEAGRKNIPKMYVFAAKFRTSFKYFFKR